MHKSRVIYSDLITDAKEIEFIDEKMIPIVQILIDHQVETSESCQGGEGHCFSEPTVRFYGGLAEGHRALAVAMQNGLEVSSLRRYWTIEEGEPTGPHWEMTFRSLQIH